ncbi:MAG: hypothetical protein IJ960_02235 [Oscillospiraceae bacterium]|nr:hypothetical protein [Oscillospiraceae bacterium]
MIYILVIALSFCGMYLLDKGITKIFRSQAQHHSGTAVRLKKAYGVAAVALTVLAVLSFVQYITAGEVVMLLAGIMLVAMGGGLGVYYLTHGIFYDDESFLYTTMGSKGRTYRYGQIRGQKLYVLQGGSYLVELYMDDNTTVSVQTSMEGAYAFLDKACHARFRQLGINSFECDWFDSDNSCWFPPVED